MKDILDYRPECLNISRPLNVFNPSPIIKPKYSPISPRLTFIPLSAIVNYRKIWNGRKWKTAQIRIPMVPLDKIIVSKDKFEIYMDRAMFNKMTILNKKSIILSFIEKEMEKV